MRRGGVSEFLVTSDLEAVVPFGGAEMVQKRRALAPAVTTACVVEEN